jgi:hypothetical protein
MGFIMWYRRRKSKGATETEQARGYELQGASIAELDPDEAVMRGSVKAPQEMSATEQRYEIGETHKFELDGSHPSKLPGDSGMMPPDKGPKGAEADSTKDPTNT